MKKNLNILIDGAGTATCISVLKGICQQKDFKVTTITVDCAEPVAGEFLSDKFYKVSRADRKEYVEKLLKICEKERVNILIPIIDSGLIQIAENKERFQAIGTKPIISSPKTIKICDDKKKTFDFFQKYNIPTPEIFSVHEIKKNINRLKYPLFIKPRKGGRASIDAYKIRNRLDLEYYLNKIKDPLVQEYLEGDEYTLDVLSDFDGKCLCIVPRLRIETKGGLAVKARVVYDKEMINLGKKIAENLKIIGPSNIQCKKNKKGKIKFFEVNPRFAGTHVIGIKAGLNSIHLIMKMYNGQAIRPFFGKINKKITMIRYWNEIFINSKGKQIPNNYNFKNV